MTSHTYWRLFCETGDPLYYLLHKEALSAEQAKEKTA